LFKNNEKCIIYCIIKDENDLKMKSCGEPAYAGRQAERCTYVYACAIGGYAYVRNSKGDRTSFNYSVLLDSPK
jgi:hypothetical protein